MNAIENDFNPSGEWEGNGLDFLDLPLSLILLQDKEKTCRQKTSLKNETCELFSMEELHSLWG